LAALQTKVASHAPASMRACLRCTVSTRACMHHASAAYCSDRGAVHEMVPTHVTVTSQIVVRGHTAPTTHGLQHTTYSNRHKAWNAQHTARDLHRTAGNIQQVTLNITQIVVSGLDHFDTHPDLMYAPAYTSLKRPGSSHSDARTNARTTSIRVCTTTYPRITRVCTYNTSTRARAHGRGAHIVATRVCCAAAATHIIYLRGDCPTSAPRLSHICAATVPHLRRNCPTSAPGLSHICAATASFVDRYLAGSHSIGSKVTLRNALATIYVRLEVESAGPAFQDDV
jgi:hypothetical protein